MSGRFQTTYIARVISWNDGIIRIRDTEQREFTLREKFIRSMKPKYLTSSLEQNVKVINEDEQLELFSNNFLTVC